MNWRTTLWLCSLALALGLFIVGFERPRRLASAARADLERVLPSFRPADVTGLELRSASNTVALALTNGQWEIRQPERHPAQQSLVEGVLARVAELRGRSLLTTAELRDRPRVASDFGLDPAPLTVTLETRSGRTEISLGARSINGRQVFYQVAGLPGIFAADADLADRLPAVPDAWRETALVPLDRLVFDRLRVSAGGGAFAIARSSTNGLWEMIEPRTARADALRVGVLLRQLSLLQVARFLNPTSAPAPEVAGLRPPRLLLSLGRGSNDVFQLALGNGITNTTTLYAQRPGEPDIMAVPAESLEILRISYKDLLDRHLLRFARPAANELEIDPPGPTPAPPFLLVRSADSPWRIEPGNLPADPELVDQLFVHLSLLEAVDVAKEVVTDLDLASYGLAPPSGRVVVRHTPGDTNTVLAQIETGALRDQGLFARIPGEPPVYLLNPADLDPLPSRPWQVRDRELWRFEASQVSAVTSRHHGLETTLRRQGTNDWTSPPGVRNDTNPFALEEALHRFGRARALAWIAEGESRHAAFGIGSGPEIQIDFRGSPPPPPLKVALGKTSPAGHRYAAATLRDGLHLLFELPRDASEALELELGLLPDAGSPASPAP